MTVLGKAFSTTGVVFAALFLALGITIFVLSSDARGEGAVLQLFVTFPWFFLCLDNPFPLWLGLIPNAIIHYWIGKGLELLAKKVRARWFRRNP